MVRSEYHFGYHEYNTEDRKHSNVHLDQCPIAAILTIECEVKFKLLLSVCLSHTQTRTHTHTHTRF